jgi:dihydrofolate reductase
LVDGEFDIVVACDLDRGIGKNNQLPWHLPQDMKHFRELTIGNSKPGNENIVIMGRNTWDSIPLRFKPLSKRRNLVLSSNRENVQNPQGIVICTTFEEALDVAFKNANGARCFVIGGAKVYEQAIKHESCHFVYLTQLQVRFDCDVVFPAFRDHFSLVSATEVVTENEIPFSFKVFERHSVE